MKTIYTLFLSMALMFSTVHAHDAQGKILTESKMADKGLDLSTFLSGIYFLKLNTKEAVWVGKLVVE